MFIQMMEHFGNSIYYVSEKITTPPVLRITVTEQIQILIGTEKGKILTLLWKVIRQLYLLYWILL